MDRLFRNLLVDMTGNTHRAEFCIDKLYPPEGSGSRLGLLELRAFEMAPHVRMGLTQLLLVRALVAMFWKQPYDGRLVRWGTALHDRFMLPHFVERDFQEVLATLQRAGYAFEGAMVRPASRISFSEDWVDCGAGVGAGIASGAGAVERAGRRGELRAARSRSVDSSLERLQVKVTGLTEARYVVACNGRRVPLHPTGRPGEAVARRAVPRVAAAVCVCIRRSRCIRRWCSTLIDQWNGRSIGGCTYHVMHPDGRSV